ncbi:hypothetical protein [Pseudomonas synxantha]|nr:hypothetical protein [Pseudomonas synxantha]
MAALPWNEPQDVRQALRICHYHQPRKFPAMRGELLRQRFMQR